jgi:predicted RNA-binding protein YlqC (UPF0109 family)|tara:strand:- start:1048 stop:1326 length:279 start_codon:yes stop_codon:yes gene_type:complete
MAFLENIDVFLDDFSDTVVYDGTNYKGILEQPDEVIADGVVLTTDYQLTAKNSDLGELAFESALTVNAIKYTVRSVRKVDDGIFCILSLMKT